MSTGLLILRLWLALMLAGHAFGKTAGWWNAGKGIQVTAPFFESLGLRPGARMVRLAAIAELIAAVGLLLGIATPLSASVAVGTMLVAAWAQSARGLWNVNGGAELALTYAVSAAVLAFTGSGRFALDHAIGIDDTIESELAGVAAVGVALLASGLVVVRARRRSPTADGASRMSKAT